LDISPEKTTLRTGGHRPHEPSLWAPGTPVLAVGFAEAARIARDRCPALARTHGMTPPPSKLPDVGTTIFTVMSALAARHGALNLAQGFPDFQPPAALLERVARHVRHGDNQYAPMEGVPELREQIALKVGRLYGREVDPALE